MIGLTGSRTAGVPCSIIRGGTSKGVFFLKQDLPGDAHERDRILLRMMGSPDVRQIDGLGGADHLTSKIVIMDRAAPAGCHATYTFGQVGIEEATIQYNVNCGNLSAGAAVFAVEQGWVEPDEPYTSVVLYNSNTDSKLSIQVPTRAGRFEPAGDFAIAGVPGTGSEILLDFKDTVGATTGKLLPLGEPATALRVPELGREIEVSVVDVAKPTLFFRAQDIDLTGAEAPDQLNDAELQRFWWIRLAAAALLGFDPAKGHLPTPVAVASPVDYTAYGSGEAISAASYDFLARRVIGPPPRMHKTFAGTGATCTAVAAITEGTVVHAIRRAGADASLVRLGHPSGVMNLRAAYHADGTLAQAAFSRTARWLLDGRVYP